MVEQSDWLAAVPSGGAGRQPAAKGGTNRRYSIVLTGRAFDFQRLVGGFSFALYILRLHLGTDPDLRDRIAVHLVDPRSDVDDDAVLEQILDLKPDLVGFSCYLWNSRRLLRLAERVRGLLPETLLILGGPDAGPRFERLLEAHPVVDGICIDEGEEALRLLVRRVVGIDCEPWSATPGFAFRGSCGEVLRRPPAPFVDLDALPSLLDDPGFLREHSQLLYITSARGCSFRCAYCCYGAASRRQASIQRIKGEIDRFVACGGRDLALLDPGFNQDRGRFREILRHVCDRPDLHLTDLEINLEGLEEEDMDLLRGLDVQLGIGLQSTHLPTLRNIHRTYHPSIFRSRAAALRIRGLRFTFDVILGLPGDNATTFRKTLDDAWSYGPDNVRVFPLLVLPGSTLERDAARFGLVYDPDPPYTARCSETFSADDMARCERLRQANYQMQAFSYDARAFSRMCTEVRRSASDLLDEYLTGAWRGEVPLDTAELDRLGQKAHQGTLADNLPAFFAHVYRQAGFDDIPSETADLLAIQLVRGALVCRPPTPVPMDFAPRSWPWPSTARPRLSPDMVIIPLRTRDPGEQDEAALKRFHVVGRIETSVIQAVLPGSLGRILTRADGHRTLEQLVDEEVSRVLECQRAADDAFTCGSSSDESERLACREALYDALGEMARIGILWWRA